jgi:hypothetical protein
LIPNEFISVKHFIRKYSKGSYLPIIEVKLTVDEQALLVQSAGAVKEIRDVVDGMNIL